MKATILILTAALITALPASGADTNRPPGSKLQRQSFSFNRVALSAEQRKQLDVAVVTMKLAKKKDTPCETIEDAAALLWRSINIAITDPPVAAEYRGFFVFSRLDWAKQDDQSFRSGFAVKKGSGEIYRWEERRTQPDGAANATQPIRSETNSTSSAAGSRRRPLR